MLRLAFLASNNGSSMRAMVAAIQAGKLHAEARLIVSNKRESPALAFASDHRIKALHIPTLKDEDAADAALCAALDEAEADLVILSGYLRKLGPKTLAAYRNRILNVHPALLPNYGGKGFYGRRVHEAVHAAREPHTGVTIHIVDEHYDHGPIVAQRTVPIGQNDTPEDIERKVTAVEPAFFVDTVQAIANGEIVLQKP